MAPKIRSAIICDLVRTENTGKQIFIGVYTGDILFDKFPAKFAPTYWVEFEPSIEDAEIELELKVEASGLQTPRTNAMNIRADRKGTTILVLRVPLLDIAGPGELRLSIRKKAGRWTEVLTKDVKLRRSEPASP